MPTGKKLSWYQKRPPRRAADKSNRIQHLWCCNGKEVLRTKRNFYAVLLLAALFVTVFGSGKAVTGSIEKSRQELRTAYSLALMQQYETAAQAYRIAAENTRKRSALLCLFVRRSLLDKINETMETLEHYALPDNPADLAVETARALSQLDQLEASFIAVF